MATNKFEKTPPGITVDLVGYDKDGFMKSEETKTFVRTDKVKRSDGVTVALNEETGEITIGLSTETITTLNESKIVSDLKDLAFKEKIRIQDIEALGDRNSQTFLSGDGTFRSPAGGGDMLKTVYDPENVNADAFSLGNMRETEDAKTFSGTEKSKLSAIQNEATKNQSDAFLLNRQNHTGTQAISSVSNLQTTLDTKFSPSNPPLASQVDGLPGFQTSTNQRLGVLEDEVLRFVLQTLTTSQKLQARMNIDAFAIPSGAQTEYLRGDGTVAAMNKAAVGLGNADNTSDANKPLSTAATTALGLKFDKTGGTISGNTVFQSDLDVQGILRTRGNITPTTAAPVEDIRNADNNSVWIKFLGNSGSNNQYLTYSYVPSGVWQRDVFIMRTNGDVSAFGALTASSKNFVIDHPADPFNFDLVHASTESPELLVEYRGHVKLKNGRAVVDVEKYYGVKTDTFKKLWADAMVHGLQNQTSFDRVRPSAVNGSVFEIISENENSTDVIAWHLIARRNDPLVLWSGFDSTDDNGKLIIEKEKEE